MYLGHVTPKGSSAECLKSSNVEYLSENHTSAEKLLAVGCDGTNVNTGRVGGVIMLLEHELRKPQQWLICMPLGNELPLPYLLQSLDGTTAGPHSFSGPLGKRLSTCEQLPVTYFVKIIVDLPNVNLQELSTDRKFIWQITNAVSESYCPDDLSKRNPGDLNHSRSLTTAIRLLRLYIATLSHQQTCRFLQRTL